MTKEERQELKALDSKSTTGQLTEQERKRFRKLLTMLLDENLTSYPHEEVE